MLRVLVTQLVKDTEDKVDNHQSGSCAHFFYVINIFFTKTITELEKFSMGRHLLLEVYDVKYDLINDAMAIEEVMVGGIKRAGMTILNVFQHCFIPQGCTIVIALSESHVSCHTWPEEGCLAIDVYTCGEGNPKLIAIELLKYLNSDNYSLREINR
jgi:S-adenosylmethionine decarboxylase